MGSNEAVKIAVLSHILPPSPSGQAIALSGLLEGTPSDMYCLISCGNYGSDADTDSSAQKLPGRYHALRPVFQLPVKAGSLLFAGNILFNVTLGILNRARQIKKIIVREKCSLLLACTGDLYDLPAAFLASRWTGVPLVPYIFDDYVFQWTGCYRAIARLLEPAILRHARRVVVPNEYMCEEYLKRYGVRSTVIHNSCPLPDLVELDRAARVFSEDEINIVYAGAIYHAHYDAFHNLLAALERMSMKNIKLHLFTAQPEEELKRNSICGPRIVYHPHISRKDVPIILRQADILFLPLAFVSPIPEVIRTSAPGKTGEYLSVGRPVLVHAPQDTFVSCYFRKKECGIVVGKNDTGLLAKEIARLIDDRELQFKLGEKARQVAVSEFCIEKSNKVFFNLINSCMNDTYDNCTSHDK